MQALEPWASSEAARILVGVFLVAAAIMAIAVLPALALGRRRRSAHLVEEVLQKTPPQIRGRAGGWADFGSVFSADRKSATTWSFAHRPPGPSEV